MTTLIQETTMSKIAIDHPACSAPFVSWPSVGTILPGSVLLMALSVSPTFAADPASHGEGMMSHGMAADHAGMHGQASTAASGQGLINSVDPAQGVVNITHEPMPALNWPEMTMDLAVAEDVDLQAIQAGDAVRFRVELGADQVYRITAIEAMP
ncbi:MAG: copper-binding protein [Sphingobacteriia bacterium]|nr:copper-binding protein [Sphingobacteriia bacterium]NCC41222.1 copper-binding protein [Gammaproteobacteria bacterium]